MLRARSLTESVFRYNSSHTICEGLVLFVLVNGLTCPSFPYIEGAQPNSECFQKQRFAYNMRRIAAFFQSMLSRALRFHMLRACSLIGSHFRDDVWEGRKQ